MAESFIYHPNATPLALLFPGQGSQEVGMAKELAARYPAVQAIFDEADDVLGFSLSTLCFDGPEEELTDTINAQPALLAASIAGLVALQSELGSLPTPTFFAGHSMGEYSALVAAGSLAYADGLRLVRERGRLMKEAGQKSPGLMAAILGLDEAVVAQLCADAQAASGGIVQVANDNCPGQIVISGDRAGMERAMTDLTAAGARKVVALAVSIAAHSPLMAPAAAELKAAIDATPVNPPIAPVIGNTTAAPLTSADAIRAELVAQLTGSVRWTASMQHALDAGVETFVEVGAGEVLTGLMKRIARKSERLSVADPAGVAAFAARFQE
ncbi:MAG: ACP S-malonyltransferase [Caldilineaceae bacterium]|nr:ACP S-malonyltransferase [Caldilineaceae bacterium]HRJ42174.1 ACP S-malonyltransferase [Caldilineaceae bacterium]